GRVSSMSLRHRLRRDALDETATSEQIEQTLDEVLPPEAEPPKSGHHASDDSEQKQVRDQAAMNPNRSSSRNGARANKADGPSPPAVENRGRESRLEEQLQPKNRPRKAPAKTRRSAGAKAATQQLRGRYTRAVSFKEAGARVALDATLRAMVARAHEQLAPVDSQAL